MDDEWQARRDCWADCKSGNRPEQAGGSYTRCTDPRACHGLREYITRQERSDAP